MSTNVRTSLPALATAATIVFSVCAYAENPPTPSGKDQVTPATPGTVPGSSSVGQALITKEKASPEKNGITRENGVIYYLKDGQRQRVEKEMHVEGLVIRPNGKITTKDGRDLEVSEGQIVSMDGHTADGHSSTTPGGAISTTTDKPSKDALQPGQSSATEPNNASPTGATRNMAPVRGHPAATPPPVDANKSASGLTAPGASSGSSLGSGSNSTLNPAKTEEKRESPAK